MPPKKEHPAKGWAASFGRVSLATPHLNQDSPENHVRVNRQTAATHGLKIKPGFEFYDRGKSGSKEQVRLPDLERAVKAVVDRDVEALVVPSLDRLSRSGMRHVGEMLDAVEAAGGRIIFGKESLDSSNPGSRAIIAFLAEQARAEAGSIAWRLETWHEGCRLKGKWVGKRPYGYMVVDGKLVPHPDEAPIIRRMVNEYMDGKSLRPIAMALNKEGIASPAGSKAAEIVADGRESKHRPDDPWSISAISNVMRNPALVGWRRHNGRIVLGPDGEPISFGEGILEPGEHARLLAEMERRTSIVQFGGAREVGAKTGGGRPARYLLTGIARCDACDYVLYGQPGSAGNASYYRCATFVTGQPCPARPQIKIEIADAEVMRQLRTRLGAMEPDDPILDAIAERWREVMMPEGEGERAVLQSRLDAVRGRIVDLEEARYVRGEFNADEDTARWDRMMSRLKLQRDAVLHELDELGPPPDFDLESLRATYRAEAWEATLLPQRRKLLQVAVAKVTVARAYRRPVPARDRVRVLLVGEDSQSAAHVMASD